MLEWKPGLSFYEVLTLAVRDFTEHGYDSVERLITWVTRVKEAATRTLIPLSILTEKLNEHFRSTYRRQVDGGSILRRHPGVSRFTLDNVKPKLRSELDKAIFASSDLIKLNRERAVSDTIQRLSGWATSVPPGGTDVPDERAERTVIRKPMASLPFVERRVIIDQGHKLVSNLNSIVAVDGGAIAAKWNSHGTHDANYNARVDHKRRDGSTFIVRGSWADLQGFVTGPYTDEIEKPGELIFCRCWYTYLYNLRSLPPANITDKGKAELQRVRALLK